MATQISNNGASLLITIDGNSFDVLKSSIKKVRIIKTNILCLDTGEGALHNVFIPYADVTVPVTANPDALKEAINAMMPQNSSSAGTATELKQIEEITLLNTLSTTMNGVYAQLVGIGDTSFKEPLLEDHSGAGVIFRGFAATGAKDNQAVWAIQRIQHIGDVDKITWANGNRNFSNVWNEREGLTYA